eukprot:1068631-Prymnesium_polylepis.2
MHFALLPVPSLTPISSAVCSRTHALAMRVVHTYLLCAHSDRGTRPACIGAPHAHSCGRAA